MDDWSTGRTAGTMTMARNSECIVEGCDREVRVKLRGYCWRHYKKWLKYGTPTAGGTYRHNAPSCKTVGCQRKPYARDMCQRCYKRWWKRQRGLVKRHR